jgi:hypothetical protein
VLAPGNVGEGGFTLLSRVFLYYQPYNYAMHTGQVHTPQPTITYPPALLQITYPAASSQIAQPKTESSNLPPPPQQSQASSQQSTIFPTFGTIHTITGGSNLTFENKRQKREHYRQVNHVVVEVPIVRTKWSHIQITFIEVDIKIAYFPHTDAMITTHIDKWNVTRVLVDNGSQAEIVEGSIEVVVCFRRKENRTSRLHIIAYVFRHFI